MIEIDTSWEWIDSEPPPPPDSVYRISYKMANYEQISDFKMSMEVSWQNTSICYFRIFKNWGHSNPLWIVGGAGQ